MARASKYITDIRAQVKADNNGTIPKHLELTIRNYAAALELRDLYRNEVMKEPVKIEVGSTGQMVTRQHPLAALLYQQELLCLNYAKALGGTSAKAAVKIEPNEKVDDNDPMAQFFKNATKK